MRSLVDHVGISIAGDIPAPDGSPCALPTELDVLEYAASAHPDTVPTDVREPTGVNSPPRHLDMAIVGRCADEAAPTIGVTRPHALRPTAVALVDLRRFVSGRGACFTAYERRQPDAPARPVVP